MVILTSLCQGRKLTKLFYLQLHLEIITTGKLQKNLAITSNFVMNHIYANPNVNQTYTENRWDCLSMASRLMISLCTSPYLPTYLPRMIFGSISF